MKKARKIKERKSQREKKKTLKKGIKQGMKNERGAKKTFGDHERKKKWT